MHATTDTGRRSDIRVDLKPARFNHSTYKFQSSGYACLIDPRLRPWGGEWELTDRAMLETESKHCKHASTISSGLDLVNR